MPLSRVHGLLLGALLLASASTIAIAQEGSATLRGRVTDRDGLPIAGARVRAVDSQGHRDARTGGDGRFHVQAETTEALRIRVSAVGYRPVERLAGGDDAPAAWIFVLERAPQPLPGISITGRTNAELADIAGAATTISAAMLRERAPLSVMDALRTVPGIQVADEDPYALNLNIGIRGLPPRRSSRTLLLEDGMPILLGPYGDPSMHYAPPLDALERVEILKGSGQIMNGPQTTGGVVNFVTAQPPTDGSRGELTVGGGSLAMRNVQLRLGGGRGGYGASVDHVSRGGEGVRTEQEHVFHNTIVKAAVPLGDDQSLLLKAGRWAERSHVSETGLTQDEFARAPFSLPFAAAGRFDVDRLMGQAVHELRLGRATLRTNAYATNTRRASWRQSGESNERFGLEGYAEDFRCAEGAMSHLECGNQGRPRSYAIAGVEPHLSVGGELGEVRANLDAGLRVYAERARRRQFIGAFAGAREDDAELTRDNSIETDVVAGFVQTRVERGPLTLSPALRIERVAQEVLNRFPGREAQLTQRYTQVLPGLGATYAPDDRITVFAGLHRGFAPPRPADIYRPEPGQPIVLVDPETSRNWELGARLSPVAGLGAEVTAFRMTFGNEIIEAPAGTGQRFVNGGRTVHQGVEFGTRASLGTLLARSDDLALSAAYTYLPSARFVGGDERGSLVAGNRLPYAPRHWASATATYSHRSGLSGGPSVEYTGAQFADESNTVSPTADGQGGLLPAYSVVSAFVSFAVPSSPLHLRASVRNLLDRVYITQRHEGIHTGVRRALRAEVRWTF